MNNNESTYSYLVELDGIIIGYFDDLLDAVTRHIQLGGTARVYKAIIYKIEVSDLQPSDSGAKHG